MEDTFMCASMMKVDTVTKETKALKYTNKHAQFLQWAKELGETPITETGPCGYDQYVVRTNRAHLRWPISYEQGCAPKRVKESRQSKDKAP